MQERVEKEQSKNIINCCKDKEEYIFLNFKNPVFHIVLKCIQFNTPLKHFINEIFNYQSAYLQPFPIIQLYSIILLYKNMAFYVSSRYDL